MKMNGRQVYDYNDAYHVVNEYSKVDVN